MRILLFFCLITSCISLQMQAQGPEDRLSSLGLELPPAKTPVANYVKWTKSGNLLFLSGHGSAQKGVLGKDLSVEQGYEAARQTGLEILATIKDALGDLSRVKRILKVTGMVNSDPGFHQQPLVINGFSDLMTQVFEEKGKHARSAVGMAALPNNIAVEIELILEFEE